MSPVLSSLVVFGCVLIGWMLGMVVGSRLPTEHVSSNSKDVIRLGMGLVATTVALVLGLLVASAKNFYDTQNNEVTELAANMVLMDSLLVQYGPETSDARATLRASVERWSKAVLQAGTGVRYGETFLNKVQELSPKDDNQRVLKAQMVNLEIQMGQTRWLIFAQSSAPMPKLLLLMLLFWLTVLFISFGLFAPRNLTVQSGFFISALAVSGAIFVMLEMYHPYGGFVQLSNAPLRAALAQLGQ